MRTLLLLDTVLVQPATPTQLELLAAFVHDVAALQQTDPPPLEPDRLGGLPAAEQVDTVIGQLEKARLIPGSVRAELRARFAVFAATAKGYQRYRPRQLDCSLHYVTATGTESSFKGWADLTTGQSAEYPVRGQHYTMLQEPYLAELAGIVREVLRVAAQPIPAE